MSNKQHLKQVFDQVEQEISTQYCWVGVDSEVQDYFDWGFGHTTTADSIIQAMLDAGDLVRKV